MHIHTSESAASDPGTYREAMSRSATERARVAGRMRGRDGCARAQWYVGAGTEPAGARVIGCKWVFKTKLGPSGGIERRKARVVAKGFLQREGVDYHETFAPTLRYTSLRLLLIVAARLGLELQQLDVTTAYLNASMEEEVYMRQPEGFVRRSEPESRVPAEKNLYGLKQAGHMWNKVVNWFLVSRTRLRAHSLRSVSVLAPYAQRPHDAAGPLRG